MLMIIYCGGHFLFLKFETKLPQRSDNFEIEENHHQLLTMEFMMWWELARYDILARVIQDACVNGNLSGHVIGVLDDD